MKEGVKFKEWQNFNIVVGKIEEIKEENLLVDINGEELIPCDKGNLKCEIGEKVIMLLSGNEGRLLAVDVKGNTSLLTVDRDVKEGGRVS